MLNRYSAQAETYRQALRQATGLTVREGAVLLLQGGQAARGRRHRPAIVTLSHATGAIPPSRRDQTSRSNR